MSSPGGLSANDVEELVDRYQAGESIRDLVASYGRAYTTLRRALLYAGVDMRPRGGDHRWHKQPVRKPEPRRTTSACQRPPARPDVRADARKRRQKVKS
jgi:hypothetical protein